MPGPYSEKQKKIARMAPPFDKITADDFKKLRDSKKKKKTIMATYQGKTVTLNKPSRITKGEPGYGRKKSKVYVKNKKGKVIKVMFGDPNMEIRKDNPAARKSFRARHKCDTATDKTTPRYWSCKAW